MNLRRTSSTLPARPSATLPARPSARSGRWAPLLVVLMALGLAACNDASPEVPAAEFGDTEISAAEVDAGLEALAANTDFIDIASGPRPDGSVLFIDGRATDAMRRLWLGLLIQRAVVAGEFADREATLGTKDEATTAAEEFFGGAEVFKGFPKEFRDAAIADQQRRIGLVEELGDLELSDAEVQAAYEQRYGEAACPTGKSVAHILVADDQAAQDLLDALADGGDFAALAEERSTDPGSASNGGELGCLIEGQFVAEFEQAALDAPVGEPVGPVTTEFGSHVILVTPYETPSFDEVEEQLRAELEQAAAQADPVSRLLVQRLSTQDITIDPAIGTFDKATLAVVAVEDDEHSDDGEPSDDGPTTPSSSVVRDGR